MLKKYVAFIFPILFVALCSNAHAVTSETENIIEPAMVHLSECQENQLRSIAEFFEDGITFDKSSIIEIVNCIPKLNESQKQQYLDLITLQVQNLEKIKTKLCWKQTKSCYLHACTTGIVSSLDVITMYRAITELHSDDIDFKIEAADVLETLDQEAQKKHFLRVFVNVLSNRSKSMSRIALSAIKS